MSNMTASVPSAERGMCQHDSTRLDGLLDNCCLKCGADGYWRDGLQIDPETTERELHPSGKMLIRP